MKKKLIVVLCLLLAASCLLTACSGGETPATDDTAATQAPADAQQGGQSLAVATKIPTQYPDYFDRKNDDSIGLGFKIGLKANKADAQIKQKPVAWTEDMENSIDEFGRTLCTWNMAGLIMKFEYS